MKVTNINGTADFSCACPSRLEHWKNFSRQSLLAFCPEESCILKPEVGALVQRENSTDPDWYIIPLCKKHGAMTGETITVGNYIELVPANAAITCGKKSLE